MQMSITEARETYHKAKQLFEGESGLTTGQYCVLKALGEADRPLILREIQDKMPVDRSTCSEIVRRLADKGHVSYERSKDDARAIYVKLTRKGRGAYLKAKAIDEGLRKRIA